MPVTKVTALLISRLDTERPGRCRIPGNLKAPQCSAPLCEGWRGEPPVLEPAKPLRYSRQSPWEADSRLAVGIGCKIRRVMNIQRLIPVCLVVILLSLAASAGKKTAPAAQQTASVNLTVVRDANGKPVKNAEVVLHLIDNHGKQKQEGLELKTHDDGKAEATGIPYGKVRIQVIAPGFKTYGEDISVDKPNLEFTIKLQKPAEQLSIYK